MACKNCSFRKKVDHYIKYTPKQAVYLDYCATTPVDIRTIGVYENACRHIWGNPSSFHGIGQSAFDKLEKCREDIREYLHLTSSDIFFTYSTQNALSVCLKVLRDDNKIKRIITTEIEHNSVYKALESVMGTDAQIQKLSVNEDGKIDLKQLELHFKSEKSILIYSPINHETGSRQDYTLIYNLALKYGSLVVLDAVQAISRVNSIEWTPFCHAFVISSHKIYGPKGAVLLYISPSSGLNIDDDTCVSEAGLFPGSVNLPLIISFAEAIKIYSENIVNDLNHFKILTAETYAILENSTIEYFRESPSDSVPGIINISLQSREISMEDLFLFLYKEKICISRFSACSGKINGPSEILKAMNRQSKSISQSIRISIGRESNRNHIFMLVKALKKYLSQ